MLKRILKGLAVTGKWLVIVIAAIGVLVYLPPRLGWYGLHAKRYVISMTGNPMDPARSWYDPQERVAGDRSIPLQVWPAEENPIEQSVYNDAALWAQEHAGDSLVVLYQGRLAHAGYFNGRTPETEFSAHSLTKVLSSILVGHAIADGYMESVDQPAADFLPEWDTDERRSITLRHLLNMAGGVEETFVFWPWSARTDRTMGTDIVAANLAVGLNAPPGTAFSHANPNSQVAGVVVETGHRPTVCRIPVRKALGAAGNARRLADAGPAGRNGAHRLLHVDGDRGLGAHRPDPDAGRLLCRQTGHTPRLGSGNDHAFGSLRKLRHAALAGKNLRAPAHLRSEHHLLRQPPLGTVCG